MKLLNSIPSWLKNKYLLTGTFFVVWMFFFDPNDIKSDMGHRARLGELKKNELHLNQLITDTKKELDQLKTNAQTIEKYAREKYMMKKDNEDLFVVQAK
ncbi:FtsB family cell division protein [Ferruginibacter albus]|uniref:FtsB family cell division protein n=1 Tax=Ferruginibacter albus TaxID=2875540 RepID=UPI001CC80A7F|nr:septum formation initiator family protein [Ferruginibacter albus]UAY52380.1 septum formation initiator family protein [Ferruginibacter albus]